MDNPEIVVNLVSTAIHETAHHGAEIGRIPVKDFDPPSIAQLKEFVALIDRSPAPTVVHCAGGIGRTGTFAAALWISRGMSAEEAVARGRKARPGAVETLEQLQALTEFERLRSSSRLRKESAMDAVVLLPGEGERIEAGASTALVKATAETTGGAFSISEATLPAGMNGPPPHAHRRTTDTFYVLDGTLRVTVGDSEIDAPAGSYILVPPGVVHTFANTSGAPVRFLNINSPGGWENYLRDLANAMRSGTMPGTEEFTKIVAKYDFVLPT